MRPLPSLPARPLAAALVCTALAGAALAAPAGAQQPRAATDARWLPWVGCWSVVLDSAGASSPAAGSAPVTCVTPAGAATVDVTTIAGGKVAARDRVDASGERRAFERDGCTGWERADFAGDGRRVHLRTEMTCANNVRRTGDAVFAVTAAGDWLDVRGATVGGYTGVRTLRYTPVPAPTGLPAELAAALEGRSIGVETARVAAAAPATTQDVVDVTRRSGAPVAAAWAAELRQRFDVGARQLAALANAGVPGSVTDVLVATAYPQRFAVGPSGAERALRDGRTADDLGRGRPGAVAVMSPMYGGWGWDAFGLGPLGFNAWNSGFFPGGGFGPGVGFLPRGAFWGAGPVVVTRPSGPPASDTRLRVVPGRGYTRDDEGSGAGRSSAGSSGGSVVRSGGGSSGGSSSGGSSSSGSGSASGSGRTAKPRP